MDPTRLPIQRWQVKFLVPTVGLVAAYAGAALGLAMVSFRLEPVSPLTLLLVPSGFGLLAGVAALLGGRHLLRHVASHVNPVRIALFWLLTGVSLYLFDWVLQKAVGWELSPILSHFAFLSSGILAAWVDEPMW